MKSFTGDFRHAADKAGRDMDVIARNSVDLLKYIASCVGVTEENHIHIVPGNHDLDRYSYSTDKKECRKRKPEVE